MSNMKHSNLTDLDDHQSSSALRCSAGIAGDYERL
ncbi:hypothetical protein JMJ77_0015200 [Colletotrichum scovillei]|uniref:Uncharacterized protein n=1 Tax=Colletotrichum scovillei TaxID=1209932 RepID=A0A9P7QZR6_9PEZI|nr:hypothetical protein JMJ77_0015200 [Colletotrichum scovillei]KAG7056821.1 hypothetical protein JMJ78_0000611 [Colletotrichum scovillei]KAG7066751.1 hypothetical protein JMJ76_0000603 [Colletotrichum scovillei]